MGIIMNEYIEWYTGYEKTLQVISFGTLSLIQWTHIFSAKSSIMANLLMGEVEGRTETDDASFTDDDNT